MIRTQYLQMVLDMECLPQTIEESCKALFPHLEKFDTIAFRGLSGAMLAPILAVKLNKQLALIRKPNDSSHSNYRFEGNLEIKNYIIVDDLISSGGTVRSIVSEVRQGTELYRYNYCPTKEEPKCVGILLYQQGDSKSGYETHNKLKDIFGHDQFFVV